MDSKQLKSLFETYVPKEYGKSFDSSGMRSGDYNYRVYRWEGVEIFTYVRDTFCLDDYDSFRYIRVEIDGKVVCEKTHE